MQRSLVFFILFCLNMGTFKARSVPADSACTSGGCCCGSDPTPAGVMISHVHKKNEWMVSYRFMTMKSSGIISGTNERSETDVLRDYTSSPDYMSMNMHMIMAMYGVNDRLTLMTMLTYNSNYMEMTMTSGRGRHHHPMRSDGLGDTRLYALYGAILKPNSQLLFSAGVSLPTGGINHKGDVNGMMYPAERLPYGMQIGSGSFDLLPGVNYLVQSGKFTGALQLSGIVRTGMNAVGYKLGDNVEAGAWAAWQLLPWVNSSLRLAMNAWGKISGSDPALSRETETSANVNNYGGQRALVYVGTSFHFGRGGFRNQRLGAEYGLPFYQNLNGVQLKQNNSFYINWSINF